MKNQFVTWIILLIAILGSFTSQATERSNKCYTNRATANVEIAKSSFWGKMRLKGSGKIIEKEITLSQKYNHIAASMAVNVIIEDRNDDKVVIKADDNVMKYVVCKVENGKLIAKFSDEVGSVSNTSVHIYLPTKGEIKQVEASSSANVGIYKMITTPTLALSASSAAEIYIRAEVKDLKIGATSAAKINGSFKSSNSTEIDASSAAKIDITLLGKEVECDVSSAADVRLNGTAEKFEADASSSADIDAADFVAAVVEAEASSGADIDIHVNKQLDAKTSSGGRVRYKGAVATSAISTRSSTGGSVKQM